ncbi:hypothetical protein B0H34DRAFT_732111 [Crassisporium funariophilum]|nr:hypothetical protein B0H34DRAFT_732111 [Crassisporium funariophilum]
MPPKEPELTYSIVMKEKDGSLTCNCSAFVQTGKTCYHILAARLEIAFGPSSQYTELETVQKIRGPKAKGQTQIPPKKVKGQHYQAVSDASIARDMDKIFRRLEEESDSPSSDEGIKSDQLKAIQTPQKGHGVTPGRPGGVKPLHPTRTPTQFSQKPGPKLKPYNSLLPALSPIKPVNFSPKKKSPKKKVLLDDINVITIFE